MCSGVVFIHDLMIQFQSSLRVVGAAGKGECCVRAFAGVFTFPLLSMRDASGTVYTRERMKHAMCGCDVTAIFTQFSRKCGVLGGSKSSIFPGLAGAAPQAGAAVRLKAGAAKIS